MALVTDEGCHLPTEIIQHIQSFMDDEETACRTSLLSKSWYAAWSTLYFIENYRFCKTKFWDFVTKRMHKYTDLNIQLDKLVLEMDSKTDYDNDPDECYYTSIVDKLIDDALSLRVNVLDLTFQGILKYSYAIRPQVFSHKYLTELCLAGCKVHCLGKVLCSDLVYLEFIDVSIYESTFKNILAGCPKIEFVCLNEGVKALKRINASELQNLKTLIVSYALRRTSGICGQFLNLRRLELDHIIVQPLFFENLSSNFPNLEDLALVELDYRYCYGSIRISTHSIKRLTLKQSVLEVKAYFYVPNIEKFKFFGCDTLPRLSFAAAPNEWKSKIILFNDQLKYNPLNLSKLRELLMQLGGSKITLRLHVTSDRNVVGREINTENFHLPEVEKLTYVLKCCEAYKLFMKCLLICRPKLVCFSAGTKAIPVLYKKLIEHTNPNSLVNDLKEVIVELYEESVKEWQPVKASDLEILNDQQQRLGFRLKWGSVLPKYTMIEFVKYDRKV